MLFLFILLIVVIAIVAASNSNKSNYSRSIYSRAYTYDDDNFEREMFDDDIHDTGEIFNRFQDGTCSKSDMELLMEDDDIRDEFYDDF